MAPSRIYSELLSEQVLDLIRSGLTTKAACEKADLPLQVLYKWVGRNVDRFADRYHHAQQDRATTWADEIVELADDCPPRDVDIRRAALRIRTRQWLIEKAHGSNLFGHVARINEDQEPEPLVSTADFLASWKRKHGVDNATTPAAPEVVN